MSIAVVRYDSTTGIIIEKIGDGFMSVSSANQYRNSLPIVPGTMTKLEQSSTPVVGYAPPVHAESAEDAPVARNQFADPPFYIGMIICALLIAGIVFFLLNPA